MHSYAPVSVVKKVKLYRNIECKIKAIFQSSFLSFKYLPSTLLFEI